jgi:hypothetical protein
MFSALLRRIAREDASIARLSRYFDESGVGGSGGAGRGRFWTLDILSPQVSQELVHRKSKPRQNPSELGSNSLIILNPLAQTISSIAC